MIRPTRFWSFTLSLLVSFAAAGTSLAQQAEQGTTQVAGTSTLKQSIQSSFRIEPVVQRFQGRRGEIIPFEFTISSLGKEMDVTIDPVNLRQELSGLILHDSHSKPSEAVRLSSPRTLSVEPGGTQVIKGEIVVPLAKTNFLSYGLLVKDRGQDPQFDEIKGDKEKTQAGIRFVTQYVLRIDVETGAADAGAMKQLRFEAGKVVAANGFPVAETILDNPTNFAFECNVRATLEGRGHKRPKPFLLGMATRQSLPSPKKHLIRIMPHSRVRLFASPRTQMFPGEQTLRVALTNGRREVVSADFAVDVDPRAYPALQTKVAYVGDNVSVTPSQIELGTGKGFRRMLGLRLANNSGEAQPVEVSVVDLNGEPAKAIRISPTKFDLRPNSRKGIRVSLDPRAGKLTCGRVIVRSTSSDGSEVKHALPLIVRSGEKRTPELDVSELALVNARGRNAFKVVVKNTEETYVPVHGELVVVDSSGRSYQLNAGYGRWMLPGEEQELLFSPTWDIPPGEYQLSLQLKTFEDLPFETRTLSVRLEG